jgi:PAS domain S-box-containing protein
VKRPLSSLLPFWVAAASLAITFGLWHHERVGDAAHLRTSFDFALRQSTTRIEQRMASYEQMLRGVQGLFAASRNGVDRANFNAYVDALLAGSDFAGLQAIAYGPLLTADRIDAHIAAQRSADAPGFTVRPAGPREAYAPTTYVAPATGRSLGLLGDDPFSDPVRRAAMLQARDSGTAALTARTTLAGETEGGPQHGFTMFLPLYAAGQPIDTIVQRREHLIGWVWAGFRMNDLMSSLYGESTPGLALRIHDGTALLDDTLMYRSAPDGPAPNAGTPPLSAQEYIVVAGHTWTLEVHTLPEFDRRHRRDAATIILVAGAGLSLLLALLTYQLATARARAYGVARTMTAELRDSEERYRRIVDTASEGIWLTDSAGAISFVNPKLLQLLGHDSAEMLGKPLIDFLAADDRAATLDELASRSASSRRELRLLRKGGGELWGSLSMAPILDASGEFVGGLGMVTDITERHQAESKRALLEAQLRESQKMEAIGTLAGGIAHDFNNILAVILGNVSLTQQQLDEAHHAAQHLGQIEMAGVRARSLVQKILAFSRMQPHALVTQPIRPLVEESIELLRSTLPASVELDVQLGNAPLIVSADATQVQQILLNLCTNAWHALDGSAGRITIGLDAAELDAVATELLGVELMPGRYAHLWVRDTGSGMDAATRARVFEPFFTTKRIGQGTGLGLSVVHGIVSAHHGAITVDSTPGRGSTFHLYFPLLAAAGAVRAEPALERLAPAGRGEHVLYVDDDQPILLMVEALLKRLGYRVTTVEHPREALQRVRDDPLGFDVVVTDFNMPELNGLELAAELAALRPGLPVAISSGFVSDELRNAARDHGVRALLQKEYTLEQLPQLVHHLLRGAQAPEAAFAD